jgi:alpha-tubulin suppressor-like RCC1 family protein
MKYSIESRRISPNRKLFALTAALQLAFLTAMSATPPRYTVANGEYANFILDNSTQTLYGIGSGATGIGSNTGVAGYAIPCQFPSANTKITFVAAGLHTASCIDVNGNVYFTGPNEDGSMGNGTTTGSAAGFQQVTTDANGNAFNNVTYLRMGSSIFTGGQGYGAIIYAIKSDGSLWVWGNTQGGYAGNGTYGQVQTRPTQVTGFPTGTKIVKVLVSNIAIALDANGNVWTWAGNGNPDLLGNASQTNYETPNKITLPTTATDIAGGGLFSYALLSNQSLYGWGWYTGYMGVGAVSGSGTPGLNPPTKPMLLDTSLNLPNKISHLSTNNTTTYVILTDGSLWTWGGNECGQAGIGQELNYNLYTVNPAPYGGSTAAPYAWNQDMSTAQFQVHKPVNIAPGLTNFVGLSEGVCAVWYKYAVDANGQLYSWGRNKSGVLGNGVMEGDLGTIGAAYPNSFDVPYLTAINPFTTGQKMIPSTSPWCITHPTATSCPAYSIPANTAPSALIAGVKNGSVNTTASTVSLDGSGSTDNVHISYYVWTQVSGPSASTITIPSGKTVNVSGLKTGTYVFQLRVTDNGWMSDSTKYTVNVNTTTTIHPVDSAGPAQTITLPTNSVTLAGTASETGGTIKSTKWTQVSGPSTATFANATVLSTTASSLVQGTYVFELTATDASGATATSTVHITVNAASTTETAPTVSAGATQTITLPTNSVTLTASASETNGTISSYAWIQTSGPNNSSILSKTQASTAVDNLVQGVYTFKVTVTGNTGLTASAVETINVNAAAVTTTPPPTTGTTASKYTIANGEYGNYILNNTTQTLYGVGNGATGIGTNTGIIGAPILCQFPTANTKIAFVAAGLHTASCIDVNGNVYFTGPNEDGSMGNGTTTGSATGFQQITTDANGNAFNNVTFLRMGSSIFTGGQGYGAIIYAVKGDGSLWVWGNTQGGYAGNGTYGQVQTRPTQVTGFPAGTKIVKVVVSNIAIALDANGGVWTWAGNGNPDLLGNASQTNYETPHQITLPSAATDIAGGGFFSYALLENQSLYGWGWYTGYMGVGSVVGSGTPGLNPPSEPMLLDTSLNLPAKIAHLSTNNTTTYVILTDGTLWSWGGNECGQAGIGQELNYAKYTVNPAPYGGTPSPYAWNQDMSTAQFQAHKPVNIAPGLSNFVGLSEGVCAVWYKFAVDANGQLYSWGRNKNGVLANGVMEGDYVMGNIAAAYPNSFDVPYLTAINPFEITETILSTSPECISTPGASSCSAYTIPSNTPPVANAGSNQTVPGPTAALDGSASHDNVAVVYYIWSQVSGPNQAVISLPSGPKANLLNLTKGTYVFQLKTIDNGWMSDSARVTIVVQNTLVTSDSIILEASTLSLVSNDSSAAEKEGFGIYPNPVTSSFTLTVSNKLTGTMNAQLIDVSGAIRHQYQFQKNAQAVQYNISAGDLIPGVYFLRVQLATWTGTLKLIKE